MSPGPGLRTLGPVLHKKFRREAKTEQKLIRHIESSINEFDTFCGEFDTYLIFNFNFYAIVYDSPVKLTLLYFMELLIC